VKSPNVAWASDAFLSANRRSTPFAEAPEICFEVLSPSNSRIEMDDKRSLYFAAGASEVWVCDKDGRIDFFSPAGSLTLSALAPDFPTQVG
jgi:Uma2 family endonuclease